MIKASRRAIFRSVFGRSGFELTLDTANEVLMRVNRSLDPIPVTERMWTAYLAMRRPLRYSDLEAGGASGQDIPQELDALVASADVRDLPKHVAADLTFLLRVETLLRMWAATPGEAPGRTERRRQLVAWLEREIARYLGLDEQDDALQRQIVGDVMACLGTAVGMAAFSTNAAPGDPARG